MSNRSRVWIASLELSLRERGGEGGKEQMIFPQCSLQSDVPYQACGLLAIKLLKLNA